MKLPTKACPPIYGFLFLPDMEKKDILGIPFTGGSHHTLLSVFCNTYTYYIARHKLLFVENAIYGEFLCFPCIEVLFTQR